MNKIYISYKILFQLSYLPILFYFFSGSFSILEVNETIRNEGSTTLINCPSDVIVDQGISSIFTGNPTFPDSNSIDTFYYEDISDPCKFIERSWIAIDTLGNRDTCSQILTIQKTVNDIVIPNDTTLNICDSADLVDLSISGAPEILDIPLSATEYNFGFILVISDSTLSPFQIKRKFSALDWCTPSQPPAFIGAQNIFLPYLNRAPLIVCNDAPTAIIDASGLIILTSDIVLEEVSDYCGLDTVFFNPDTLNCDDIGDNTIVATAIDLHGNQVSCQTVVTVQDTEGRCSFFTTVSGQIVSPEGENIERVNVSIDENTFTTQNSGGYVFNNITSGSDITIIPQKNINPLNGVSTFDLVLMSKHILGLQSFDSPYKYIAADVDKSGSITAFDMVQLRKLILNVTSEFPNNTSWRFVDAKHEFTSAHPAAENFAELISIDNISSNYLHIDFIGSKIGDINGNAASNSFGKSKNTAISKARFSSVNISIDELEIPIENIPDALNIPVRVSNFTDISGIEFNLSFDSSSLEFLEIENIASIGGYFGTTQAKNGKIAYLWYDSLGTSKSLPDNTTLFELKYRMISSASTLVQFDTTKRQPLIVHNDLTESLPIFEDGEIQVDSTNYNTCCTDSLAFVQNIAQGWTVNIDSCTVTVSAPQFDSCHWLGTPILWDDGTTTTNNCTQSDTFLMQTDGGFYRDSLTCCGASSNNLFMDDGTEFGNYVDDTPRNDWFTICPPDASLGLKVVISSFDLSTGDTLCVYDGADSTYPLIGAWSGAGVSQAGGGWAITNPCPPINPSGCMTFNFKTNGDNFKGSGWNMHLECQDRPILLDEPWTHTYDTAGTYIICTQVFEGNPKDLTSCWSRLMCDTITIDGCPPISIDTIPFEKWYGDSLDNAFWDLKYFDNAIFATGITLVNGNRFATFSKLDLAGNLIWSVELDSIPQIFQDFTRTDNGDFLLVGRTEPYNSSNQSLIARINSSGVLEYVRYFNHSNRERFTRIAKSKNPANPQFPYYILAQNVVSGSTQDDVFLYEVNNQGTINTRLRYNAGTDEEFVTVLLPLQSGGFAIMGNTLNNGAIVNTNNAGIAINAFQYNTNYRIISAISVQNDAYYIFAGYNILGVPHLGKVNAQTGAVVWTATLNAQQGFFQIQQSGNGDLYVLGYGDKGDGINRYWMNKFIDNGNTVSHDFTRYLDFGETSFIGGRFIIPPNDQIIYTQSGLNPNFGFGGHDIFFGVMDLDFSFSLDDCYRYDTSLVMSTFSLIPNPMNVLTDTVATINFVESNLSKLKSPSCIAVPLCAEACNPIVECPQDTVLFLGLGETSVIVNYPLPVVIEDCERISISCFPPSGSEFFCGTTPVYCYIYDSLAMDWDTCIFNVIVDCSNTCQVDFNWVFDINCLKVNVDATNTIGAAPINFLWKFPDAMTSNLTNPMWTAPDTGMYEICLEIIDAYGCKDTVCQNVPIYDNTAPKINCPSNISVNVPDCERGSFVNFDLPIATDSCGVDSVWCNYESGDFFACGRTTVTCYARDIYQNVSSYQFFVDVNCLCAEVLETDIVCGDSAAGYDFCIYVRKLNDADPGACSFNVMSNQEGLNIEYSTSFLPNDSVKITGSIGSTRPIPTLLQLEVVMECICTDNQPSNCTLPVNLTTPCCDSIYIEGQEICAEDNEFYLSLNGSIDFNNIAQTIWYKTNAPCPAGPFGGKPYQNTNGYADLLLLPEHLNGDVCIYAEVIMKNGPCKKLISNSDIIEVCQRVTCSLENQEHCYTGTPVQPDPLELTIVQDEQDCEYTVIWLDENEDTIQNATGLTYTPPAINFMSPADTCSYSVTYTAIVNSVCGSRRCSATIRLDNDQAAVGDLTISYPAIDMPYCPGQDVTLQYDPICVGETPMWQWHSSEDGLDYGPIDGSGPQNPVYNTNRLFDTTWFLVTKQNGVCETLDSIALRIDIKDSLRIAQFTAKPLDPCRTTGVGMSVDFNPNSNSIANDCGYQVDWYKDGQLLESADYTSSPVTYNYVEASLNGDYSGNYYVVVTDKCCAYPLKSAIEVIESPMEVSVTGPCFLCFEQTVELNGLVENSGGVACTYQWYQLINSVEKSIDDIGHSVTGTSNSTLAVDEAGTYVFEATCGDCTERAVFVLTHCNDECEVDQIAPTVVCQTNITIDFGNNSQYELTPEEVDNGSFDNCEIDTMYLLNGLLDCSDIGTTMITLVVVDKAGNSDSCSTSITITDSNNNCTNYCQADTLNFGIASISNNQIIAAKKVFYTKSTITVGSNIKMMANDYILLQPGFHAQAGSTFSAKIEDCESTNGYTENSATFSRQIVKNPLTKMDKEKVHFSVAPNPFQTETQLNFSLPKETKVAIHLFDQSGKLVQELVAPQILASGQHQITLTQGELQNGLFYAILQTPKQRMVQKIVLIKNQ